MNPVRPEAVCRRLSVLRTAEERRLIWFLHSALWEWGGDRVASEICERFPERIKPGERFSFSERRPYRMNLFDGDEFVEESEQEAQDRARGELPGLLRNSLATQRQRAEGESECHAGGCSAEDHIARYPFPPWACWFRDLPGTLLEYERRTSAAAAESFYRTNIGREIWQTLDWCLETRRPCVIEGEPGRGKSENLRAYAAAHRGEVRLFTVPGYGCQRDVFHACAAAWGMPHATAKSPSEIRFRLEDVARRSGLALLVDEAHHLLSHRSGDGRPPLIDWIDSALVDKGVPVVLCVTPQFAPGLAGIQGRAGWNAAQFRWRFTERWLTLPRRTSKEDLEALAARLLPKVGTRGVKAAVEYAHKGLDVAGLGPLVLDARRRAAKAGRSEPIFQDVKGALELERLPSDNAMAAAFARPVSRRRQPADDPIGDMPAEPLQAPCEPTAERLQVTDSGVLSRRAGVISGLLPA